MSTFADAPLLGPAPPMRQTARDDDVVTIQRHLASLSSLPLEGDEEMVFHLGMLPGGADVTDVYLMLTDQADGTLGAD